MEAYEAIITLIKLNNGEIKGRAKLQKLVFFASEILDLDISFRPYYYGPYCDDVAISTDYLRALKMISETEEHFPDMKFGNSYESVRYGYELSEGGENYFIHLSQKYPNEISKLKEIIKAVKDSQGSEISYKELSIAAKVFYILKNQNIEPSIENFKKEAKNLGWDLESDQITKSFNLLKKIFEISS